MAGLLVDRLRCWWRGHTFAVKFRDNDDGLPVPGYECTDCLAWKPSPFGD